MVVNEVHPVVLVTFIGVSDARHAIALHVVAAVTGCMDENIIVSPNIAENNGTFIFGTIKGR